MPGGNKRARHKTGLALFVKRKKGTGNSVKLWRQKQIAESVWVIVITGGLYGFYLSKKHIDKTRYESMKVRERMRIANQAEYTPERNFKLPEVPVVQKKSE